MEVKQSIGSGSSFRRRPHLSGHAFLTIAVIAMLALAALLAAAALTALITPALPASAQGNEPQIAPETPDTPAGKAIHAGIVDVEWDEAAGAESYEVQVMTGSEWIALPGGGMEITFYGPGAIVGNLPYEGRYFFRVRSVNAAGTSDWSNSPLVSATGRTGSMARRSRARQQRGHRVPRHPWPAEGRQNTDGRHRGHRGPQRPGPGQISLPVGFRRRGRRWRDRRHLCPRRLRRGQGHQPTRVLHGPGWLFRVPHQRPYRESRTTTRPSGQAPKPRGHQGREGRSEAHLEAAGLRRRVGSDGLQGDVEVQTRGLQPFPPSAGERAVAHHQRSRR